MLLCFQSGKRRQRQVYGPILCSGAATPTNVGESLLLLGRFSPVASIDDDDSEDEEENTETHERVGIFNHGMWWKWKGILLTMLAWIAFPGPCENARSSTTRLNNKIMKTEIILMCFYTIHCGIFRLFCGKSRVWIASDDCCDHYSWLQYVFPDSNPIFWDMDNIWLVELVSYKSCKTVSSSRTVPSTGNIMIRTTTTGLPATRFNSRDIFVLFFLLNTQLLTVYLWLSLVQESTTNWKQSTRNHERIRKQRAVQKRIEEIG